MESPDLAPMLAIAAELVEKPESWRKDIPLRKWGGVRCGKTDGVERVKELRLNGCTGKLSPAIGRLAALRYLEICGCSLLTPLPSTLGELAELRELFIARNPGLPGPIPDIWGALPNLAALAITYNPGLQDEELPASIGNLKKLTFLDLHGLSQGNLEENFSPLRKLEFLRLSAMDLKELPQWVYQQKKLAKLYLPLNPLCSISPDICTLSELSVLDLSACGVTSAGLPGCLSGLTGLVQLALAGNPLGVLPPWITDLKNLSVLAVQSTGLSGPFPEELFALQHLTMLNLAGNKLSGTIPDQASQWRYWTSMADLNLSHNDFSGAIPDVFDKTAIFFRLNVTGNKLDGPLPPSLRAKGTLRRAIGIEPNDKRENTKVTIQ